MKPFVEQRPKQTVPQDLVYDLLGVIRRQFCPDLADREWHQQKGFFLRVVTEPAKWLTSRGVTLQPDRYKQLLLAIFDEVKVHGETAAVQFWPGYLLRVVQRHLKHHEDELYAEAKSVRAAIERALQASSAPRRPDPVEGLAQVNSVLARRGGRAGRKPQTKEQLSLL